MTNAEAILAAMTLEEKAALCTGASAWTTMPIMRLGLPALTMADGPHGVRRVPDDASMAIGAYAATCFPTASCTASSWDVAVVTEMGVAIAEEAIALGVDIVLGPGVNIKRSPLCGRNFEYFSEDPYLAGEMAVAWIDGIQSRGVGASLKHLAVNNQETRRMSVSAEVDGRTMREIYLPAFEAAVKRSQPWTVMCSYNRINGVYGSEHRELLTEILRGEWGFEGFTVSDWGAVHDRPRAVFAGMDLEMPGPRPRRTNAVIDAVRLGQLAEADLDKANLRILRVVLRATSVPKGAPFDQADHHALARRIAGEGMVLLKNDGVLPLRPGGRLAVIGRAAVDPHFQGGGSSHMTPTQIDVPIDELAARSGGAAVSYVEGYPDDDSARPDLIEAAVEAARGADVALLYVALPTWKENEGRDRTDLALTLHQVALINAVAAAQPRCVVVLFNGSAVTMVDWIDGPAAVLEAWMSGQAAGGAVADILFGAVNPSGKLAETFPLRLEDTPAYLQFPGDHDVVRYGEGPAVGYRWYDGRRMPVQFPFGFGLSYTTFAYEGIQVASPSVRDVDRVTVTVDVTNTGLVAGAEVIQVYVRDREASLSRPDKELKGFAKVQLAPDETKRVEICLEPGAFSFFHPGHGRWVTESGEFEILVGASATDIRGSATVTVEATEDLPTLLTLMSTPSDWLADPRGRATITEVLRELAPRFGKAFGASDGSGPADFDPLFRDYLMFMPVRDVVEFGAALGTPDPDGMLERLQSAIGAVDAGGPQGQERR